MKNLIYFIFNKLIISILLFTSSHGFSQNNSNFMVVNENGNTFEINPILCSYLQLNKCTGATIGSIALVNDTVYFSNGFDLYKYTYHTNMPCEYVGTWPSTMSGTNITSLASSPSGIIYAAAGNSIFSYNPINNIFIDLGILPSIWQSAGDLIFFENKLLLVTYSNELINVNISDLANSSVLLTFPNNFLVYGLAATSASCITNELFALNTLVSTFETSIQKIILPNNLQPSICNLPFGIYDACSLSENGLSNIVTPKFSLVSTFCQGAVVPSLPTTSNNGIIGNWSPTVIDNQTSGNYVFTPDAGQCAIGFTQNVSITPSLTPTFNLQNTFCQGANVPTLPNVSDNSISGTWSPNVIDNQNSGVYVFTSNAGICANSFSLNVVITPNVTPTFDIQNTFCQNTTVPVLPTISNNSISGIWSPNVINNQNSGTYVFTPNLGSCANSFSLNVVITPNFTPIFSIQNTFCKGATVPTLPNVSDNAISGTWSPNVINNQNSSSYVFTPNSGSCADSFSLNVVITPNVTPTFSIQNTFCKGAIVPNSPTISNNSISGTWSPSVIDNQNSSSYVFTPNSGICANSFTLNINIQTPTIKTENLVICKDNSGNTIASIVLDSKLNANDFAFAWTLNSIIINQSTTSISVEVAGNYQLIATANSTGCQQIFNFNITDLQPITANYIISEDFDLNQSIVVEAFGSSGQYLYSFDNLPFDNNATFSATNSGDILVKVKDTNTCYEVYKIITLWQYPRFFTPNNDGFNDTWTIKTKKKITIDIFDRFGKLLKQIQTGESWNGTINSQLVPATDYWFVVYYDENKIFKGHFSLKR